MKIFIYSILIPIIMMSILSCVSTSVQENEFLPLGGNINAINHQLIPDFSLIEDDFNYCKQVEYMVENWAYEWNYHIPKEDILSFLLDFQKKTATLAAHYPDNREILLLQMLLSNYLYNLDSFEETGLLSEWKDKLLDMDSEEYRGNWFHGSFLCRAGVNEEGIILFLSVIRERKEKEISPYFWKDFSLCASMSGMPSHVRMSLDKIIKYFGEFTSTEEYLMEASENMLMSPENKTFLNADEIWTYKKGEGFVMATNRFSGFAIKVKDEWEFQALDYQQHMCAALIQPEIETTEQGKIGYNFIVFAVKPEPGETLSSYIDKLIDKETYNFKRITMEPALLKDSISYLGKSELMYPDVGGGRFIICGIEREEPPYPGLKLERPLVLPGGDADEENRYYRIEKMYRRLQGKIFYVILVDTCGLIYDISLSTFESFIEECLIIE